MKNFTIGVLDLEQGHRSIHLQAADEKARTESIIAAIGDGISIQDTGFRVLYQNRVHRGFVGEQTGRFCYAAYEQRDTPCEECPLAMSFRDGEIHTAIRMIQQKDRKFYAEITASPLRDATGKIVAGIEVVRDVSERKRLETAADEVRDRLQSLVEHIPGAVYRREANPPWKIIHISEEIYQISGYHAGDFINALSGDFRGIVFSEDQEFFDRVLQEGITARGPYEIEYRIQHADSGIRWVYEKGRVVSDGGGKPLFPCRPPETL